jgi:dihydroxyacid dehydratase/phosphogluconate dehydratase
MKTVQARRRSANAQSVPSDLRAYSSIVVDGPERAASRAMLYAVGFKKEDFKKPQVGVVSTWSQVTPCNIHIDQLAVNVAMGVNHHHFRRHLDGVGRHEVFAGVTRGDCRFD